MTTTQTSPAHGGGETAGAGLPLALGSMCTGYGGNARELAEEFGITPEYVMQLVHNRYRKGA